MAKDVIAKFVMAFNVDPLNFRTTCLMCESATTYSHERECTFVLAPTFDSKVGKFKPKVKWGSTKADPSSRWRNPTQTQASMGTKRHLDAARGIAPVIPFKKNDL